MKGGPVEHDDRTTEGGEEPWVDPVIEAYKKDVDRTLIRFNLQLTVQQRLENLEAAVRDLEEIRRAMIEAERARGQAR